MSELFDIYLPNLFITCLLNVKWLKKCTYTIVLCTFFCTSIISFADSDDSFNLNVGTVYKYDSNLFRLPAGSKPIGDGAKRADSVYKTNFGFKVDKNYSLQRFKIDYLHEDVDYKNADFLDFNANNYNAAWLWALTPSLKGSLSSSRVVDLVPFIDFNNSDTLNLRTTKTQIFDFDWSPHNVWHLVGGYSNVDSTNSQTFLPETSYKFNALEGGLKYTFPSESYITFKLRNRSGSQVANSPGLISTGFSEKEEELTANLILSGKSKVAANLGHNKRDDNDFAIRDFSGYFGGVDYIWDATSKLNLNVNLTRRLASFQDTTSSFTVNDVLSIRPAWAPTPKLLIKVNAQIGKRRFLGDGPLVARFNRQDDVLIYGVGLDWTPRSTIKISFDIQHDQRRSNFIDRDYSANIASVNGQLTF